MARLQTYGAPKQEGSSKLMWLVVIALIAAAVIGVRRSSERREESASASASASTSIGGSGRTRVAEVPPEENAAIQEGGDVEPAEIRRMIDAHGAVSGYSYDDRVAMAEESMAETAEYAEAFPTTDKDAIVTFWNALAANDMEVVTALAPGSTAEDWSAFHRGGKGLSMVKSIGEAEAHPKYPEVRVYPIVVDFMGRKNHTVKMATVKTEDGRIFVDGRYCIWF